MTFLIRSTRAAGKVCELGNQAMVCFPAAWFVLGGRIRRGAGVFPILAADWGGEDSRAGRG